MSTVIESIEVNVGVRQAYDQWTQFESFPRFMEGVERIEQRDEQHLHWTVKVGGVTREFDATITEQRPNERVAWRSDAGPTHRGQVTFEELDADHTRVTTEMEIDPEGFVENVADKLGILDHRVKGDLRRFKQFIEEQPGPTGAWRGEIDEQQGTGRAGDSGAAGAPADASGRAPGAPGVPDLGASPDELGRPAT